MGGGTDNQLIRKITVGVVAAVEPRHEYQTAQQEDSYRAYFFGRDAGEAFCRGGGGEINRSQRRAVLTHQKKSEYLV